MKLKAGEIRKIGDGLKEILDKELPVKPAYWLARIATKLESEGTAFEKARISLVTKHAKKDKDGKPEVMKDKNGKPTNQFNIPDMEAFNKEYLELANQEIDLDINPIKLADLGDISLKPVTLARLNKIIEE
jgi:hypothetical protein